MLGERSVFAWPPDIKFFRQDLMNYLELMRSGQSLDPAAAQSVLHTCTLLLHALIIQYSNSMYVDAQICTVLAIFQADTFSI